MSYERSSVRVHRILRLILMLLIGILTAMLVLKIGLSMTGQTILPVRTVQVTGNRYLTNNDVISLLGLQSGTSMLFLNLERTERLVMQDERIRRVQLVKIYPDTLRVHVREKDAAAVLDRDGTFYLVSSDGVILTGLDSGADDRGYSDYPFISLLSKDDDIKIGNPVNNILLQTLLDALLRFQEEQPDFSRRIESCAVDELGIWVRMRDMPHRIYLGSEISVEKLNRLRALVIVLEQVQDSKGGETVPLEIDMSFSHAAVREGDANNEL
jgi:hypothetical protein